MSRDPRPLVAGNWKMNGLKAGLEEIVAMRRAVEGRQAGDAEIIVCPPATLIISAAAVLQGGPIALGAQDCHPKAGGAYTGDISAAMLKDAGASYVIVGHSERRAGYGESDALVRSKAEAANEAGLAAIICVGETKAEREAGEAVSVVSGQIRGSLPPAATPANLVVAYEPVWAIGTGLTPTASDVADMHASIRALLGEIYGEAGVRVRILYGGSVKPSNARELLGLPNVDGALVGGASLKANDFMGIAGIYA
ncbi:triose-phosphate isomerase [Methylocapsa sp. S129]|uniref:triose-phosphate isomerase n=1 Tax=Methylocapsa sp. S129 TaxID=1641869 RepID=UPI00131E1AD0|nr:triose-phosphate isomerase [Methylocapsa sp. S129]